MDLLILRTLAQRHPGKSVGPTYSSIIQDNGEDVKVVLEASRDYGLSTREADDVLKQVRTAVVNWREEAAQLNISKPEQELIASAFEES